MPMLWPELRDLSALSFFSVPVPGQTWKKSEEVTTTTASTESLLVIHRTEPLGQSWL